VRCLRPSKDVFDHLEKDGEVLLVPGRSFMIRVPRVFPVDVNPVKPEFPDAFQAGMSELPARDDVCGDLRKIVGVFPSTDREHHLDTLAMRKSCQ
jgi:hypothetical protein